MYKPPASAAVRKDSITHVWPLLVERWVFKLPITFQRLFASLERLVSVLLTAIQPLKRVTIPSFSPRQNQLVSPRTLITRALWGVSPEDQGGGEAEYMLLYVHSEYTPLQGIFVGSARCTF